MSMLDRVFGREPGTTNKDELVEELEEEVARWESRMYRNLTTTPPLSIEFRETPKKQPPQRPWMGAKRQCKK